MRGEYRFVETAKRPFLRESYRTLSISLVLLRLQPAREVRGAGFSTCLVLDVLEGTLYDIQDG